MDASVAQDAEDTTFTTGDIYPVQPLRHTCFPPVSTGPIVMVGSPLCSWTLRIEVFQWKAEHQIPRSVLVFCIKRPE